MKIFIRLILVFWAIQANGQVTIRLGALPAKYTPILDTLFIAGNFNDWNPRDTAYRFKKNAQGQWQVVVNSVQNPLLFKTTRGSWPSVEVAANGQDIPNRSQANVSGTNVEIVVADWADTRGTHTATSQVSILTSQLWLHSLKRYRRIWVCVPPDYTVNTTRRYPVIYLHDAQNLFDAATSFAGEWKVDEALNTLSQQPGWEPLIAVGVDNGGDERINELTPFRHPTYGGGQGELYGQALVDDVKPLIDSLFRTKKDLANTAVGGSSLGGIETLYMGYAWPQVYSKLLVFSPSLWYSDSLQNYIYSQPQPPGMRMYLLCGTNESSTMVGEMNSFYNGLLGAGFPASQMSKNIITGGTHSEGFWSQHVKNGLEFLFANVTAVKKNKSPLKEEFEIIRNEGIIDIQFTENQPNVKISLVDFMGRKIPLSSNRNGHWNSPKMSSGWYLLQVEKENQFHSEKLWLGSGF